MKHKKLTEYEHVGCDGPGCGDCALKDDDRQLCSFPCPQDNTIHLIPAADAEQYDRENAAMDAVCEAVEIAIDSGEVMPISKVRIQKAIEDWRRCKNETN